MMFNAEYQQMSRGWFRTYLDLEMQSAEISLLKVVKFTELQEAKAAVRRDGPSEMSDIVSRVAELYEGHLTFVLAAHGGSFIQA